MYLRRLPDSIAAVYRYNSGLRDSSIVVLRDTGSWQDMWRRLTAPHSPSIAVPPIDFKIEMAVVAALGERRTGGYGIEIEAVRDRGTFLDVRVRRRAPGRGCGVTGSLTAPADVVIVPQRPLEVQADIRDTIVSCGPP